MQLKLNFGELLLYFFVWIAINLLSLYKLYKSQNEIFENDPKLVQTLRDLEPGWKITSRLKDVSDIEWSSWKYFIQTAWFYLIIQFVISEIIRKTKSCLLKYWYLVSSLIFLTLYMGIRQLIIISAQPILYATILFFGGQKISIWITSIILLLCYNSLKYKYFFWYFLDHENLEDEEVYLIIFSVAWIELRCISFCLDYIETNNKLKADQKQHNASFENIINMFSYVFYLPLLYTGPVVLYEDFVRSFNCSNGKLSLRLKHFLWDMTLFLFYTFLLDLAFHYIYFFAMQHKMESIRKLPTLAFCAGGLWMGLEFHMKYVISYGTTGAFAKLDNFDPPPTPRCIARVHVYSQMWRYFDVGLYRFLVKYIYKPCFEIVSKYKILSRTGHKLVASLATFVFIFIWHGILWHIFVWSVLNYLGIILEKISYSISKTDKYKWFKVQILKTEEMETRFIAALCTPLLGMSAISNFYLFGGTEVGNLYCESVMYLSVLNVLFVIGCFYCCCHVSMALEGVPSRTASHRNTTV